MGCCGEKRRTIIYQAKSFDSKKSENRTLSKTQSKFRYMGNKSLEIRSPLNYMIYYFTVTDPVQTVLDEDIDLLRTCPDLNEL